MAEELATSRGADYGEGSTTGIVVTAAANSVVATITIPRGATRLFFEVKNSHSAAVAFDQFDMQRRAHASGNWSTFATNAGDYSSPAVPLLEVAGAPVTLAQNASVFIGMDVEGTDAVRILASGTAVPVAADIHYRIQ